MGQRVVTNARRIYNLYYDPIFCSPHNFVLVFKSHIVLSAWCSVESSNLNVIWSKLNIEYFDNSVEQPHWDDCLVSTCRFQVINDASFYGVSAVLALWLGKPPAFAVFSYEVTLYYTWFSCWNCRITSNLVHEVDGNESLTESFGIMCFEAWGLLFDLGLLLYLCRLDACQRRKSLLVAIPLRTIVWTDYWKSAYIV